MIAAAKGFIFRILNLPISYAIADVFSDMKGEKPPNIPKGEGSLDAALMSS
jgi:hypothetical protein